MPPDRVRELVRSIVQLERSEAKTVRPERYARLGVEDVDAPNSKSKEIVLQTTTGTPAARLIVGTAASGFGADGGTYVRIPGDSQAWLARGALAPSLEPRDWVERRLIEIPVADIRQVKIVQPGGATLTAVRDPRMLPAFGWPSYRPAASWPDQMQSTHWFNPSANLRSRTSSPETKDRSRRIRLCGLRSLGWTAAPLLSTLWKTTAGTGFDSRKARPQPTCRLRAGRWPFVYRVGKLLPSSENCLTWSSPGRDHRARNRRRRPYCKRIRPRTILR